jgi:hypothetical protein
MTTTDGLFMKQVFWIILLLFIGPLVITSSSAFGTEDKNKQIIVVFRFDDPSSISDTNLELKVLDAFQKNNLPCTLGVIPFVIIGYGGDSTARDVVPLDDIKADILKKAIHTGLVEVALHGYSHQTTRSKIWGGYSEFQGLDYTSQALRIEKGKTFLEALLDVKLTTFIPPFDNFDHNTIKLLESFDFEVFSSNMDQAVDINDADKIKFLPATCGLLDVRSAIESARLIVDNQPIIIVLMHHRDFWDANRMLDPNRLDGFIELLNWIRSQNDIRVVALDQAAKVVKDASTGRFLKFTDRFILRLVPPFINERLQFPVGVYYSTMEASRKTELYAVVLIYYFMFILCITAITFLGGILVLPRSGFTIVLSKYGLPIMLVLGSFTIVIRHVIKYRGAHLIAVLIAMNIGIWCARRRIKRQVYQLSENRNSLDG